MKTFFAFLYNILLALILILFAGWAAAAFNFRGPFNADVNFYCAIGFFIICALSFSGILRSRLASWFALVGCLAVTAWFYSIRPSNDRLWLPDVSRAPHAELTGDMLTIHDIRNFDYRSELDFTPNYYDRTFDLSKIKTLDYLLSHWGSEAIAHSMVSFGFENGQYITFSVETRKEIGEEYSTVQGFFKQYELIYIVGDERDLLRLRTNYRNEDLYMFRTRIKPSIIRSILLDYIEETNSLYETPRFYNALTSNCMTNVLTHLTKFIPDIRFNLGHILSGYSAEYAYNDGSFDHSISFEELKQRGYLNPAAKAADKDPLFSEKIRVGVPQPPVRE